MQGQTERVFHKRSIELLAREESGSAAVVHAHSLAPVDVAVPPLATGCHFLDIWPVREWPDQEIWRQEAYSSYAPPLFVLHHVLLHGSAGIICLDDMVVDETLAYTSPERHGYRALARGIALQPEGPVRTLRGVHISVLAGAEGNYSHAVLDGLARIAAVPANYIAASASLLVPENGACGAEMLRFLDLPPSISVREVGLRETLLVEHLVLPLSVAGEAAFHPCVLEFFRRVSANVPAPSRRMPRRIVIDQGSGRSGAARRGLLNAGEVLQALARQGFAVIRLEEMKIADRICLFRQAEVIVSPQGAGLADIGFARPGCVVVELMPDSMVDWRFRNLAALARLQYDCVLGRAQKPWRALDEDAGATAWEISVQHVVAAVAQAIGDSAKAA